MKKTLKPNSSADNIEKTKKRTKHKSLAELVKEKSVVTSHRSNMIIISKSALNKESSNESVLTYREGHIVMNIRLPNDKQRLSREKINKTIEKLKKRIIEVKPNKIDSKLNTLTIVNEETENNISIRNKNISVFSNHKYKKLNKSKIKTMPYEGKEQINFPKFDIGSIDSSNDNKSEDCKITPVINIGNDKNIKSKNNNYFNNNNDNDNDVCIFKINNLDKIEELNPNLDNNINENFENNQNVLVEIKNNLQNIVGPSYSENTNENLILDSKRKEKESSSNEDLIITNHNFKKSKSDPNENSEEDKEDVKSNDVINTKKKDNNKYNCFICENFFPINRLFSAECNTHFLCKRCAANYYEDKIENSQVNQMYCPCVKCGAIINNKLLKKLVSGEHFKLFCNRNEKNNIPEFKYDGCNIRNKNKSEYIKNYSKRHVIEVGTNRNFYRFNKDKDLFCPKCCQPSLFSKTSNSFIKCLNCGFNQCKFCFKEFGEDHLEKYNNNHCKVYYRNVEINGENGFPKKNFCQLFLIQICLMLLSFFMTFIGCFFYLIRLNQKIFCVTKETKIINYFKMIMVYLISTLLFLIIIPILFIFFPFFPLIVSFTDLFNYI